MVRAGIIAVGLLVVALGQPMTSSTGQESAAMEDSIIFRSEVSRVIDSLRTRFRQIEDYQVRLTVSIKMPGLRMPRKRMTFSFKQPDKVHLKARGFAMIPKRGIMLSPDSMFARLSNPVLIRASGADGCPCLVIEGDTNLMDGIRPRMAVTVDTIRWVVTKIHTRLGNEDLLALETTYAEVVPGILMPAETRMHFEISEEFQRVNIRAAHSRRSPDRQTDDGVPVIEENSKDSITRTGEAVISYSRYRVNQGLDDALFEEE